MAAPIDHVHEPWYGDEAEFVAYCEARAYTIAEGDQQAALIRSSTYIDAEYGSSFIGYRTHQRDQPRAWPRTNAYDAEGNYISSEEIPIEVRHATYECTVRELEKPGSLQPDIAVGKIKQSVTVGSVSVTYANVGDISGQIPTMTILDGILAPLLGGGNSGASFVGFSARTV